ncbi:MAG: hypothetical protein HY866_23715 [Chloroflexi bacterium]|nr:hypothetical protein [Chloroflexota bacterium]
MTSKASSWGKTRRAAVTGSIPVITFGLLLVTFAMLRAPWPPDPQSAYATLFSYSERLQGKQALPPLLGTYQDTAWYIRRGFDVMALVLLVAGYISTGAAIWFNSSRALVALIIIGALGAFYGGTVGLFTGPILALGGFALVFFGAGLYWLSQFSTRIYSHNESLENGT